LPACRRGTLSAVAFGDFKYSWITLDFNTLRLTLARLPL
jgi:hypothetical protein